MSRPLRRSLTTLLVLLGLGVLVIAPLILPLLGLGLICLTAALAQVAATSQLRAAIALADQVGAFV